MGASQRTKGVDGEREVINLLKDHLGIDLSRNLDQVRNGGADCMGLPGVALEIKRAKKALINPWWEQAVRQAEESNRVPVLAYRIDRQQWVFIVPLYMVDPNSFDHRAGGGNDLAMTAALSIHGFCAVWREFKEWTRIDEPMKSFLGMGDAA